jgi:Domain of unknown function (DUF929)
MGKAERNRQLSAREKIAAQQAAARKAQARRRGLIAGGAILVVLAIVVGFVVFKLVSKPTQALAAGSKGTAASVTHLIATVPASALDGVGAGPASVNAGGLYPHAVQTIKTPGAVLTSGSKPQVVYVGAEYCPFCAAERWALGVALSRFGTFSHLSLIHSSSTDVYPNTPTLSFYKSAYTSKYLVFTTTEAQTVSKAPLQKMTALDNSLMAKYDAPPYVPTGYNGSFPFVDFGNKYVIAGASYNPQLLSGMTWQQVASSLAHPDSPAAKGIDAAANHITAAICKITGGQPASVCTSSAVTSTNGSI